MSSHPIKNSPDAPVMKQPINIKVEDPVTDFSNVTHEENADTSLPSPSLILTKKGILTAQSLAESSEASAVVSDMTGVGIFAEPDFDGEAETRLRFFASDAEMDNANTPSQVSTGVGGESVKQEKARQPAKRRKAKYREPSRLSLVDRIRIIRMCSQYKSLSDVQKAWKNSYGPEVPCRRTISSLNTKFDQTGSVADLNRTGRPKSTRNKATVARVEDAVRKDPNKSIRALAKELGINQASVHRIKRDFEDNRSTLRLENKKLKEKLKDACKRIVLLERRLALTAGGTLTALENTHLSHLKFKTVNSTDSGDLETLVLNLNTTSDIIPLAMPSESQSIMTSGHTDMTQMPSIVSVNGQLIPPLLRLQQPVQDTVHIIALPQGNSHQLLSLDGSTPIQLAVPNDSGTSRQDTTKMNST